MQITDYHAKYYTHELTKRCSSDNLEKLTTSLFDAQVDLNPHHIETALFAFKSPSRCENNILQNNVEWNVGFFDAEIGKLENWAEDVKTNLEEKVKTHQEIKELEKKRNEMRLNLYQVQDDAENYFCSPER